MTVGIVSIPMMIVKNVIIATMSSKQRCFDVTRKRNTTYPKGITSEIHTFDVENQKGNDGTCLSYGKQIGCIIKSEKIIR